MILPMQMTRRSLLSLIPAAGASFLAEAAAAAAPRTERLEGRLQDGRIHVAAPKLDFLSGKPLERLQNGAPVPFALELGLSADRFATLLQRDIERFVFSYDLWEEKFSIARLGRPRQSVSRLAARAAEAWTISQMSVASSGLAERAAFWLRLQARAENPSENWSGSDDDAMSLSRLIEIFGRRARTDPARWSVEAGPFRLAELRGQKPEVLE